MTVHHKLLAWTVWTLGLGILGWAGQTYYTARLANLAAVTTPSLSPLAVETVLEQNFQLTSGQQTFTISPDQLSQWLEPYQRNYHQRQEFQINLPVVRAFLDSLATDLDQPARNARLAVDNEGQLIETSPGQASSQLDREQTIQRIFRAANHGENRATIASVTTLPVVNLQQAQARGISTQLGHGESDFTGSPLARTHNISVGAKTFDSLWVEPGAEFSFNNQLGEVTASTGYRAELVIKNHTLIPEYGGGLCQVSTTLFRAALAAGLPILERHYHSLPVRYYAPQGFDATIYPGQADLRFKNDTAGPLLIQSQINNGKLVFEIFGQSDGRSVTIDGPHIYERQPSGALKTWLKQIVTKTDGTEQKTTFYSNYQSPSLFPTVRNPLE